MNKAFMLHVFSLPVGSAGVAAVLPALSLWGLSHLQLWLLFFQLASRFWKAASH